ncbi:poly polymerase 2 ADP-ribosyltransferase 2 [Pelomyxa schiedti]|nr:poly polymerase 2 ADP-ribosyltransferase 2 [Pelomyxa schiedti]
MPPSAQDLTNFVREYQQRLNGAFMQDFYQSAQNQQRDPFTNSLNIVPVGNPNPFGDVTNEEDEGDDREPDSEEGSEEPAEEVPCIQTGGLVPNLNAFQPPIQFPGQLPFVLPTHLNATTGSRTLEGLTFCVSGDLTCPIAEFTRRISLNRGCYTPRMTKKVTHLVSSQADFDSNSAKVSKAKEWHIPIVTEQYVNQCIAQLKKLDVADFLLGSTHSPEPISELVSTSTTSTANSGASLTKVDEYVPGALKYKVVVEDNSPYSCWLNQTNISCNNNKFYHIQLLQDAKGIHYIWSRWGRVGDRGQNMIRAAGPLDVGKRMFMTKFLEKTGKTWEQRNDPSVAAPPGSYVMLNLDS